MTSIFSCCFALMSMCNGGYYSPSRNLDHRYTYSLYSDGSLSPRSTADYEKLATVGLYRGPKKTPQLDHRYTYPLYFDNPRSGTLSSSHYSGYEYHSYNQGFKTDDFSRLNSVNRIA